MKTLKKQPIIIYIYLIFLFVYIVSSCNSISTKTYRVTAPVKSSIKILLISDLHSTIFGKDQSILIEKIISVNPDLILMAGDIYDHNSPTTGVQLLLSGISGIAPINYVTGNHEYWRHDLKKIKEELISYGVTILSDEYKIVEINNSEIVIAGIDDPYKKYYEMPGYNQNESMENAFRELDELQLYKILIAHRPEEIETYKKFSFDLILSGHTHGGQIRIPFGLYAPNQGLFPKYSGGVYKHDNLTHIISRGLSINHPRIPRIFNPPELVIIIVEP